MLARAKANFRGPFVKIAIAGAGSIGCFVGGALAAAGHEVVFLARPRIAEQLSTHGLHVSNYADWRANIEPKDIKIGDAPSLLADADLVLVTVKSGATIEMGKVIAAHAKPDATIISLQNGVTNTSKLKELLPDRTVLAGMVPYNVVQLGEGRFHQGTTGNIMIEDDDSGLAAKLNADHLPVLAERDMAAVQWGKLLINLNNALNALSGIPLLDQLSDKGWRSVLADQIIEAIAVLDKAEIPYKAALPISPKRFAFLLKLPTPLFRLVAGRMLTIDPAARSSMWEDFQNRRKTEIDELQGAIVTLGRKHHLAAPLNQRVAELIRQAEKKGEGSPKMTPQEVRRR